MTDLSTRELQVAGIIRDHKNPSYQEISAVLGVSRNRICEIVKALKRKGYVRRRPGKHQRALVLIKSIEPDLPPGL